MSQGETPTFSEPLPPLPRYFGAEFTPLAQMPPSLANHAAVVGVLPSTISNNWLENAVEGDYIWHTENSALMIFHSYDRGQERAFHIMENQLQLYNEATDAIHRLFCDRSGRSSSRIVVQPFVPPFLWFSNSDAVGETEERVFTSWQRRVAEQVGLAVEVVHEILLQSLVTSGYASSLAENMRIRGFQAAARVLYPELIRISGARSFSQPVPLAGVLPPPEHSWLSSGLVVGQTVWSVEHAGLVEITETNVSGDRVSVTCFDQEELQYASLRERGIISAEEAERPEGMPPPPEPEPIEIECDVYGRQNGQVVLQPFIGPYPWFCHLNATAEGELVFGDTHRTAAETYRLDVHTANYLLLQGLGRTNSGDELIALLQESDHQAQADILAAMLSGHQDAVHEQAAQEQVASGSVLGLFAAPGETAWIHLLQEHDSVWHVASHTLRQVVRIEAREEGINEVLVWLDSLDNEPEDADYLFICDRQGRTDGHQVFQPWLDPMRWFTLVAEPGGLVTADVDDQRRLLAAKAGRGIGELNELLIRNIIELAALDDTTRRIQSAAGDHAAELFVAEVFDWQISYMRDVRDSTLLLSAGEHLPVGTLPAPDVVWIGPEISGELVFSTEFRNVMRLRLDNANNIFVEMNEDSTLRRVPCNIAGRDAVNDVQLLPFVDPARWFALPNDVSKSAVASQFGFRSSQVQEILLCDIMDRSYGTDIASQLEREGNPEAARELRQILGSRGDAAAAALSAAPGIFDAAFMTTEQIRGFRADHVMRFDPGVSEQSVEQVFSQLGVRTSAETRQPQGFTADDGRPMAWNAERGMWAPLESNDFEVAERLLTSRAMHLNGMSDNMVPIGVLPHPTSLWAGALRLGDVVWHTVMRRLVTVARDFDNEGGGDGITGVWYGDMNNPTFEPCNARGLAAGPNGSEDRVLFLPYIDPVFWFCDTAAGTADIADSRGFSARIVSLIFIHQLAQPDIDDVVVSRLRELARDDAADRLEVLLNGYRAQHYPPTQTDHAEPTQAEEGNFQQAPERGNNEDWFGTGDVPPPPVPTTVPRYPPGFGPATVGSDWTLGSDWSIPNTQLEAVHRAQPTTPSLPAGVIDVYREDAWLTESVIPIRVWMTQQEEFATVLAVSELPGGNVNITVRRDDGDIGYATMRANGRSLDNEAQIIWPYITPGHWLRIPADNQLLLANLVQLPVERMREMMTRPPTWVERGRPAQWPRGVIDVHRPWVPQVTAGALLWSCVFHRLVRVLSCEVTGAYLRAEGDNTDNRIFEIRVETPVGISVYSLRATGDPGGDDFWANDPPLWPFVNPERWDPQQMGPDTDLLGMRQSLAEGLGILPSLLLEIMTRPNITRIPLDRVIPQAEETENGIYEIVPGVTARGNMPDIRQALVDNVVRETQEYRDAVGAPSLPAGVIEGAMMPWVPNLIPGQLVWVTGRNTFATVQRVTSENSPAVVTGVYYTVSFNATGGRTTYRLDSLGRSVNDSAQILLPYVVPETVNVGNSQAVANVYGISTDQLFEITNRAEIAAVAERIVRLLPPGVIDVLGTENWVTNLQRGDRAWHIASARLVTVGSVTPRGDGRYAVRYPGESVIFLVDGHGRNDRGDAVFFPYVSPEVWQNLQNQDAVPPADLVVTRYGITHEALRGIMMREPQPTAEMPMQFSGGTPPVFEREIMATPPAAPTNDWVGQLRVGDVVHLLAYGVNAQVHATPVRTGEGDGERQSIYNLTIQRLTGQQGQHFETWLVSGRGCGMDGQLIMRPVSEAPLIAADRILTRERFRDAVRRTGQQPAEQAPRQTGRAVPDTRHGTVALDSAMRRISSLESRLLDSNRQLAALQLEVTNLIARVPALQPVDTGVRGRRRVRLGMDFGEQGLAPSTLQVEDEE